MAFDEGLAERIRDEMRDRDGVVEKKMFSGLVFMLNGHMFAGVIGDTLMARVGAANYADALARPHARAMDMTGRPMKGMVLVAPAGIASDAALAGWIAMCVRFVESLPPK